MRIIFLRFALAFAGVWFAANTARGQNVILAGYHGKRLPVVKAHRDQALVKVGDKLVEADGADYNVIPVDEFLPMFVAVTQLKVSTFALELMDSPSLINNEFKFRATFDSPYDVKDVFLVLQLKLENGEKSLFLYEIGDLGPDRSRNLDLAFRLGYALGKGNYTLHLFSRGAELLHSEQPFSVRERALDHIVAKRITGRTDGPPTLLIGPTPDYPKKLLKAGLMGSVVLHCTVRANGAVLDPVITSATDPAFGEAALAAVRLWRFIPRLKSGHPVDTEVNLPLNFAPPTGKP